MIRFKAYAWLAGLAIGIGLGAALAILGGHHGGLARVADGALFVGGLLAGATVAFLVLADDRPVKLAGKLERSNRRNARTFICAACERTPAAVNDLCLACEDEQHDMGLGWDGASLAALRARLRSKKGGYS
jgi:hypothetical protein